MDDRKPSIPSPGDFPIGSPESRAAVRLLVDEGPPYIRIAKSREEYREHQAALKAGKVFRYGMLPGKAKSNEEWAQMVQEEHEELERERAAEKAAKATKNGNA